MGSAVVEGIEEIVWARGSIQRKQNVSFQLQEWQAIGGAAAKSQTATKYLLKQVEELTSTRDQQPVFIQWNATDDPAASLNATDLHDGWYVIDSFEPDYKNFVVSGIVTCRMTVTQVAPAPPRRMALAYAGAGVSSNFSGAALNLLSLPIGSTALESSFTRTGAEGSIPCVLSPFASPEPILLSTTLANIWKGGVHVYDTINTGSNPVPTSGGTFVHANWVEIFGTDHDFVGDCVVTNGLQLLLFQTATTQIATCYLWNTATAVANWQQYGLLIYRDNAAVGGTLRSYTLTRVGAEEASLTVISSSSSPQVAAHTIRLQRGRYEVRVDFRPLSQTTTVNSSLLLTLPATHKILYNSSAVADNVLSETAPAFATDYGYGSAFIASTTYPFIVGLLYQNEPGTSQPGGSANNANVTLGDTVSLATNAQRSYGFSAIPYGVSGTYSTANLQAEAESGSLGTGWTSQANAAASGGNEAKCASGTVATNADLFGTSFVPSPGAYDVWFRVKVTTNVGSALEMTLGLWDTTASSFVTSTTFNRTAIGTSYGWVRAGTPGITPTNSHNMQFRAVTALTLGTDWFVDEAALVPKTLLGDNRGSQDLWQQFIYDRGVRWIRP